MIEIIKKAFTILVNTEHLRFLLGLFFVAVAMTGAIEILQDNWAAAGLSPIYYSVCLFAGCWLLFGNKE